jgi:hypothetical protein
MDYFNFLNIEYLLLRLRDVFSVVSPDGNFSAVSQHIAFDYVQMALAGLAVALVLLVVLVYFQIRLLRVEHEGFHKIEEKEIGAHMEPMIDSKNLRWERVMSLVSSTQESDWRRAIVEADIMLGVLLTDQGYKGKTIGDQLKIANPLQFSTLDLAWKAHKVRNDIAHGGEEFHLSELDARATIDYYARVFEEFKIL